MLSRSYLKNSVLPLTEHVKTAAFIIVHSSASLFFFLSFFLNEPITSVAGVSLILWPRPW